MYVTLADLILVSALALVLIIVGLRAVLKKDPPQNKPKRAA